MGISSNMAITPKLYSMATIKGRVLLGFGFLVSIKSLWCTYMAKNKKKRN
jgi:hypothetical protein